MRRDGISGKQWNGLNRLRPWLSLPLVALVVVTLVARLIEGLLPDDGIGWVDAVRGGLAAMFAIAATAHFGRARVALIQMVPRGLPNPPRIVLVTGLMEIAGVVGLIVPETARLAAICLLALLVAVFPANVQAARRTAAVSRSRAARGRATPLWFRAIVQVVFIAACGIVAVAG